MDGVYSGVSRAVPKAAGAVLGDYSGRSIYTPHGDLSYMERTVTVSNSQT